MNTIEQLLEALTEDPVWAFRWCRARAPRLLYQLCIEARDRDRRDFVLMLACRQIRAALSPEYRSTIDLVGASRGLEPLPCGGALMAPACEAEGASP